MELRDERLEKWCRFAFEKANCSGEHDSMFVELFRMVFESFTNDNTDPLDDPSSLVDVDDPSLGTAHDYVEERSAELLRIYIERLKEGHSKEFARIFVLAWPDIDDIDRTKQSAFGKLGTSWECTMANPVYSEVYNFCLFQGRTEVYAKKCAEVLFDVDLSLERAIKYCDAFDTAMKASLGKGHSTVRAEAYAKHLADCGSEDFSAAFAKCFEEQVRSGRTERDAWTYAKIYLGYFERFGTSDEEAEDYDESNELVMVETEGHVRSEGKGYITDTYVTAFSNCYYALPWNAAQTMIARFDQVEALTDKKMQTTRQNGIRGDRMP